MQVGFPIRCKRPWVLRCHNTPFLDRRGLSIHSPFAVHNMDDAFVLAAHRGDLDAVSALLADGRADPAASDSMALIEAAQEGWTEVVNALLADGRADPAAQDNSAIEVAAYWGHTAIVAALLADGRADPAARNSSALRLAAYGWYVGIVQALLADGRADCDVAAAAVARRHNLCISSEEVARSVSRWQRWLRRRQWLWACGRKLGR